MDDHTPDAGALAEQLISDLFGNSVGYVCRKLLDKGSMSISQLSYAAKPLSTPQIRSCLLVLIQHNFVRPLQRDTNSGPQIRSGFVYEAQCDKILQNLRKPWILFFCKTELNQMCEYVVEAILENGRLRFKQILTNVATKLLQDTSEVETEVKTTLVRLITQHYVERSPPCSLPKPPSFQDASPSQKRQRTSKNSSSDATTVAQKEYLEYEKERFRLPLSLVLDDEEPHLPEKHKKDELIDREEGVLWRVNFEEFNRSCRHETCVNLVTSKIGKDAGLALKCMLDVSRLSESKVNEDASRPISRDEIQKALEERLSRTQIPSPENFDAAINALKDDQLELVTYMGDQASGSVFCVNLTRIIECCQLVQLETSIRDRFGRKGLRIFRLLLFKRQLEQKQIADLTMLDPKEARSLLYDMFRTGFVILQDIPKSADHAASRTFFTWTVSLQDAASHLRRNLYRAARNVHFRLGTELKKGNELLTLLELSQTHGESIHITDKQRTQTGKLSNVLRVLELSLMNLDQAIGVMNNFSC
eukprot:g7796.t1